MNTQPSDTQTANNQQGLGTLLPLLTVNFIGTLGYSLVIPFLVYIVIRFGGNEVIYGLLGATYSFFQLFGAPMLGRYSDQVGRRRVLFLSQLGTLLSWILFLITLWLPVQALASVDSAIFGQFTLTVPLLLLFFARAVDGLTGGNISVATAYVVDISTDESRSRNMGRMALSTNAGFIMGPLIAGALGTTVLAEKLPVMTAIGISVAGLLAIVFFLPESKPQEIEKAPCGLQTRRVLGAEAKDCFDPTITETAQQNRLKAILNIPEIPLMFVLYFLIFLAFNLFYATFPIHAAKGLGWQTEQLGLFFSVLSATMILVQGPVLGRLNSKFQSKDLFLAGSIFMFASFVSLGFPNTSAAYLSAVLFAIGNGIMWPSFMALLAELGGTDVKGYIQGTATAIGSLASIIGLVAGGLVYAAFDGTIFIAAGIVFLFCFAAGLGMRKRSS